MSTFNQTNSSSLLTDWLPGCVPDSDWPRSLMLLYINILKKPFDGIFREVGIFGKSTSQ